MSLTHWFIASLNHWFNDSSINLLTGWLIRWTSASLHHWFNDSWVHWFCDSLLHWLIDLLMYCARILSCYFIGIWTTISSFVDALHNFKSSLVKNFPLGHLPPIVAYFFRSFRPSEGRGRPGNSARGFTLTRTTLNIPFDIPSASYLQRGKPHQTTIFFLVAGICKMQSTTGPALIPLQHDSTLPRPKKNHLWTVLFAELSLNTCLDAPCGCGNRRNWIETNQKESKRTRLTRLKYNNRYPPTIMSGYLAPQARHQAAPKEGSVGCLRPRPGQNLQRRL